MSVKHFTEKALSSLRTNKSQEDCWDRAIKLRGVTFGVRVYRSGSKEFICRYRFRGKRRLYSIGDATVLTLAEARTRATRLKAQLEEGVDPILERRRAKQAPTINELCDLYLKIYAYQKKDGGAGDRDLLHRDVLPRWGELKIQDIRRCDVIELLDYITHERGAPVASNRTRAVLSRMFKFALEREMIQQSPCVGLPRRNEELSRDRVLSDEEIRTLWPHFESDEWGYGKIAQLMLLTAQRPSEVCGMRWSEIKNDCWVIPAERTKTARTHMVPLSPVARQILNTCSDRARTSDFVFPTSRSECVKSRTLQRYIRDLCVSTGTPVFTPHDLRRTARTNFSKLRVDEDIRERLLNHTPARIKKTYDIYDYLQEKKEALEKWERYLIKIVRPSSVAQVLPLQLDHRRTA